MAQEEFQALLQFFRVLADENRLKLLGILAQGERSVEELAAQLQLKAPTISHHLAKLREIHLVNMRTDGNTHYYRLDVEALRDASKQLLTPEKMTSWAVSTDGDAWEQKVLRDFFEGERLKEIPASRKKRSVILKWLAERFDYDTVYTEKQVNEILQRYHVDSASLRREMINSKEALIQREHMLYWRTPGGKQWQTVTLRSADRQALQCRVGVPAGQGPFPTLIELHEGPEAKQSDWLSPLAHYWVEQGFVYMSVNYRHPGPDEFGLTWQERVGGEPGRWEVGDIITACDWLIQQELAIPQRIMLLGWSYSASMVLLALARYPADWAAAIVGNIVADWLLAYDEVPDSALLRDLFQGEPQEKHEQYRAASPLTYASQVTAPLLLMQPRVHEFYTSRQVERYVKQLTAPYELHWLESPAPDIRLIVEERERIARFAIGKLK
jgi:DNA-binding transcriptional ArsR family regulator/dienelactone hydrolase